VEVLVDLNVADRTENTKNLQEPNDDADDDDAIEDGLDAGCHGNEAIDEAEEHAYDDKHDDDVKQIHEYVLCE
jgi:hypothetical protein